MPAKARAAASAADRSWNSREFGIALQLWPKDDLVGVDQAGHASGQDDDGMNADDEGDQPEGGALRIERRTFVHGGGTPMN